MNEWKNVKLKDVADIFSGYAFKSKDMNNNCGTPLIKIKNINDFIVSTECDSFLNLDIDLSKWEKYRLQINDFLIAMTGQGSVGRVGKMMNYSSIYFVNQRVAIVRPNCNLVNPYFLYKIFATNERQLELFKKANGAGQPNISPSQIGDVEFYIPNIKNQCRIATILSRYDSLIENYQKQIKLLEESAQRLYKEWFIDLRFPGHENTKIVDGVPEGWEKKSVDSIFSIKYGKNLSTTLISESGVFPVYGANGVIGYYDKANCNEQVVLITSRGNGSGDVLMTYHKEAFITNNSFIVTPLEEYLYCQLPFTYQFLKCANFRNVRTGAAQPQLTNQSIHTIDVILPTKDVIVEFCKKTDSNNSLIINLKEDIRHLTEARDRLLPKLMSGEIIV